MELLNKADSRHIVKLYKQSEVESSLGEPNPFREPFSSDGASNMIARMYIEYCEGGDMEKFIGDLSKKYTAEKPVPEEASTILSFMMEILGSIIRKQGANTTSVSQLVWRLFQCLMLGVAVMENGNESFDGESWDTSMLHLDIKPGNVFVGTNDKNHLKTPVLKFGDFGGAAFVPKPPKAQTFDWLVTQMGTPGWESPEQFKAIDTWKSRKQAPPESSWKPRAYDLDSEGNEISMPVFQKWSPFNSDRVSEDDEQVNDPEVDYDLNLKYGPWSNLWSATKILWHLINRGHEFDYTKDPRVDDLTLFSEFTFELSPGKLVVSLGPEILRAPYSATLRKTIAHCMAKDWQDRPSPREVLKTIEAALAVCQSAGPGQGLGSGFNSGITFYDEPPAELPDL